MLHEIARDLGKDPRFAEGVEASLRIEKSDGDFEGLSFRAALHQVANITATGGTNRTTSLAIAFDN